MEGGQVAGILDPDFPRQYPLSLVVKPEMPSSEHPGPCDPLSAATAQQAPKHADHDSLLSP